MIEMHNIYAMTLDCHRSDRVSSINRRRRRLRRQWIGRVLRDNEQDQQRLGRYVQVNFDLLNIVYQRKLVTPINEFNSTIFNSSNYNTWKINCNMTSFVEEEFAKKKVHENAICVQSMQFAICLQFCFLRLVSGDFLLETLKWCYSGNNRTQKLLLPSVRDI